MLTLLVAALLAFPPTSLTGPTQWGHLEQTGKNVVISGSAWTATGEVRKDGLLVLFWINGNRQAIGLYQIADDELTGIWNWSENCDLDADGILSGEGMMSETIRRGK